ncbi:MAG: N(4)-(beta-N-acetylglucosaminyl)-L-asparaginase [Armatimonadetes bacterium]|nr:N(4)-(beta-N-acetylglucosaminyl)-L-asparaginase [Armatimonadota bacterium]
MNSNDLSRRELVRVGLASGAALAASRGLALPSSLGPSGVGLAPGPIAISSANGLRATEKAVALMRQGRDTVEAAVEGVVIVEEDPNDMSVGYGGLPNELGIVELDACVMHGPTMRAGSVASIQNIKTPSRVAKAVMERTDHVMLVGAGALAFAKQMGFEEVNMLTDRARRAWLRWKTTLSKEDDWLDDEEIKADFGAAIQAIDDTGTLSGRKRPTGTISCLCLNDKGELGGCTTTSGLAWKLPGRIGDSPIIGAGLYVDGEVGAAGSTGRGEANILVSGGRTVVENMKDGMTPMEACLDVLKRVCDQTKSPRLLTRPGRPNFDLNFYALRKDGAFGAARIVAGGRFAVNDGKENKLHDSGFLFDR